MVDRVLLRKAEQESDEKHRSRPPGLWPSKPIRSRAPAVCAGRGRGCSGRLAPPYRTPTVVLFADEELRGRQVGGPTSQVPAEDCAWSRSEAGAGVKLERWVCFRWLQPHPTGANGCDLTCRFSIFAGQPGCGVCLAVRGSEFESCQFHLGTAPLIWCVSGPFVFRIGHGGGWCVTVNVCRVGGRSRH